MEKLTPFLYDDAVSSANLQPIAIKTSALELNSNPQVVPLEPVCHANNGWSFGNALLPIIVVITAAPIFSARVFISLNAPDITAPPPSSITGRFDVLIKSIDFSIKSGSPNNLPIDRLSNGSGISQSIEFD